VFVEDDDHQRESNIKCGKYLYQQYLHKGFPGLKEIMAEGKHEAHQEDQVQISQWPLNIDPLSCSMVPHGP
jgi:hypothetical protein